MTDKKFIPRLLKEVKLRWPVPAGPRKGLTLVEHGGVAVLMRTHTQRQAETSILSLKSAYEDWNEVRVSQVQEIAAHLEKPASKRGATAEERRVLAAGHLKDYLHEVFQKTHGLDLEFMREDLALGAKTIAQMPILGLTAGSYLLWLANGEQVPVHLAMMRFLDRLGLIGRTTSVAKAKVAIAPLVPTGSGKEFTTVLHEALERWTDPDRPIFEDVAVLRECAYGTKAFQERQSMLAREEAQRKRDEQRRNQQLKKEDEQRRKDEERARKKAEGLAKRHAREAEKRRRATERKAKAEAKKVAADKAAKKKLAEKAKALVAKKKAAERAKAAALKKKAADKKKAAATKKKASARKKATAKKKASAKKPVKKKPVKKKPAAKKKATAKKKAVKKKPVAKKKAAKKASKKKPAARKKPAAKKASARRPAVRKTAAGKSKSSKKKPTRSRSRR